MRTALITGGAKRLGRALVEHYAQAGWRVLFTSQWSVGEGTALADGLGEHVHCLRARVSTQRNAASVADVVARHTERLDLLVCNASTFERAALRGTTEDAFAGLLQSNLVGPYFLIQQCVPLLARSAGCVVNIADAQAQGGIAFFSAYAAAKAGLVSITKSLAVELAPDVHVNAVLSGTLEWPVDRSTYSEAERADTLARIPAGRIGCWADVVRAVDYLAGATYVTGACLTVDGGRTAAF